MRKYMIIIVNEKDEESAFFTESRSKAENYRRTAISQCCDTYWYELVSTEFGYEYQLISD